MKSDFFAHKNWGFEEEWSLETAEEQALTFDLTWKPQLQGWITGTRCFYESYAHSPNMRALVKHLQLTVDPSITSTLLQVTLKANPALVLSFLAGIPRPKQCF